MTKLTLCITAEDIDSAERFKVANPVLHKLHQATGTLWRMCSDGLAMEIMPPFRATLLPVWTLRDWNSDFAKNGSANGCVLPGEIELELHSLQTSGNDGKADENIQRAMKDGVPAYETMQNALLQVLERNGWSNWRAVCPHIFVEGTEPYRTIVLTNDVLRCAQDWMHSASELSASSGLRAVSTADGNSRGLETMLRLPAELHSPLMGEPVQSITINFPLRLFEDAVKKPA